MLLANNKWEMPKCKNFVIYFALSSSPHGKKNNINKRLYFALTTNKNDISYGRFERCVFFGQILLMIVIVFAQMADVLNLNLISFHGFFFDNRVEKV